MNTNSLDLTPHIKQSIIEEITTHSTSESPVKKNIWRLFCQEIFEKLSVIYVDHLDLPKGHDFIRTLWEQLKNKPKPSTPITLVHYKDSSPYFHNTHPSYIQVICHIENIPFVLDTLILNAKNNHCEVIDYLYIENLSFPRNSEGIITVIDNDKPIPDADTNTQEQLIVLLLKPKQSYREEQLKSRLLTCIEDVRHIVYDWQAMQSSLDACIQSWSHSQAPHKQESIDFMLWIKNHFLFFATKLFSSSAEDIPLGIIKTKNFHALESINFLETLNNTQDFFHIGKTNQESHIHRVAPIDFIYVHKLDNHGNSCEQLQIFGLLDSTAYDTDPTTIPWVRKKIQTACFNLTQHSRYFERKLLHRLKSLPREELFQATPQELTALLFGLLNLKGMNSTHIYLREDRFKQYTTCLLVMSKEYYNSKVKNDVINHLKQQFKTQDIRFLPHFSELNFATLYVVIKKSMTLRPNQVNQLKAHLKQLILPWKDQLAELVSKQKSTKLNAWLNQHHHCLQGSYEKNHSPKQAYDDIKILSQINSDRPTAITIQSMDSGEFLINLYQYNLQTYLSDIIPILEQFNFLTSTESSYKLHYSDNLNNQYFTVHRVHVHFRSKGLSIDSKKKKELINLLYGILVNNSDSDMLNALCLHEGLNKKEIQVLRAYTYYAQQVEGTSIQFSFETLIEQSHISALLVKKFTLRFSDHQSEISMNTINEQLNHACQNIRLLSQEKLIRFIDTSIDATVRTNYNKVLADDALSFKILCRRLKSTPSQHIPEIEIFVFSPTVMGTHLRMSRIARGGIRWSDRNNDFRTEVTGLMSAQQLKNSSIGPDGAKGVFVARKLKEVTGIQQAYLQGLSCYKAFIKALLSLTDNIKNHLLIASNNPNGLDTNDTYIVVAADKGTATFSDKANQIAKKSGYWLGDAFASGGSHGYDHKKLGITAKGAWVSLLWHCHDFAHKQESQIKLVGIGDMSGDVFGNLLTLSDRIQLIAAFDHRDIFIDPNPDTNISYQERKRLQKLKHSSWQQYDPKKLSPGGGVFSRQSKYIELNPAIMHCLDTDEHIVTPDHLIRLVLCCKTDVLFNGGIGTYIIHKDDQINGDSKNKPFRVMVNQVRAKTIVEGGNLGITQKARIDFANKGGKINTDFIDNSAGVMISDQEVNIKILLNLLLNEGQITNDERNRCLESYKSEVVQYVLNCIEEKNFSLSLASHRLTHQGELYIDRILSIYNQLQINIQDDVLPTREQMKIRNAEKKSVLLRPELAILFSRVIHKFTKIIENTDLINDSYFLIIIKNTLPKKLTESFPNIINRHPLHKNIIATGIANQLTTLMGLSFLEKLFKLEHTQTTETIKLCYAIIAAFKLPTSYKDYYQPRFGDSQASINLMSTIRDFIWKTIQTIQDGDNIGGLNQPIERLIKHLQSIRPVLEKLIDFYDFNQQLNELNEFQCHLSQQSKLWYGIYTYKNDLAHGIIINQYKPKEGSLEQFLAIQSALASHLNTHWLKTEIKNLTQTNHWDQISKETLESDIAVFEAKASNKLYQEIQSVVTDTAPQDSEALIHEHLKTHYSKAIKDWKELYEQVIKSEAVNHGTLFLLTQRLNKITQLTEP